MSILVEPFSTMLALDYSTDKALILSIASRLFFERKIL